jgi:hypothetical protein
MSTLNGYDENCLGPVFSHKYLLSVLLTAFRAAVMHVILAPGVKCSYTPVETVGISDLCQDIEPVRGCL